MYGKERAEKVFFMEYDKIFDYHGLAWKLGKANFRYFCEIYLYNHLFDYSNDKVPLSDAHYAIWDELQDTILNKNNTKNCYIFPRSFGKSATITVPFALWVALYRIHPFVVVDSATEAQAQNFIETMKILIEDNQYIMNSFGNVINKDLRYNANEIELDISPERSKIKCVSSTSGNRGITYGAIRVGLLILDDAQDENQIKTEESCAAFVQRIENGLMKTLENKNNHVIAVGTVQKRGDLYDTYFHSPAWISKTQKTILIDDIDDYFMNHQGWQKVKEILQDKNNPNAYYDAEDYYYAHRSELDYPIIWENYNCFALAVDYFNNPVSFKQERQCDINNLGQRRIHSYGAIPAETIENKSFTKTILSVDPASTTNKKSDYSAFCVLSESDDGLLYARKCQIKKLEFNDYIQNIIDLLLAYTDINTVSIEKQTYNGADVIELRKRMFKHPELKYRNITIINKARSKNKEARISALCVPAINMKQVIFNADDGEAINQIISFCGVGLGGTHDDMIDCLADAIENLPNVHTGGAYGFVSFREIGYF